MGTKRNSGTFDCYANAAPDEPMFVLLARDPLAPKLVRMWADLREQTCGSSAKVLEARACALDMERYFDPEASAPLSEPAAALRVLSDEIYELSRALRFARDDYRDARDGETAARFDRFADEALELSKLALRACAEARPSTEQVLLCKDDEHLFGPCSICGMPYLASRLEPPTAEDIAWAQTVIDREHAGNVSAPPRAEALAQPQQALNHEGEPLHTGDDERIDLVSSIIASAEEIDGDEELTDIAASIIEDAQKLDALLIATIQRERRAEALAPHPQTVDTKEDTRGGTVEMREGHPTASQPEVVRAPAPNIRRATPHYVKRFDDPDDPPAEICICAAVQFADGRIVRGHRHDSCFITASGWTPKPPREHVQGFITSRNRFVNRTEGASLQNAAGLISAHTGKPVNGELFSEDLYFDTHDHVAWNTPYQEPNDGAQPVADSAEIVSPERSTSARPRDRAQELLRSAKSSDGRAAALDAAPSTERLNAAELLPRGYLTIQQAQGVKHPFRAHAFNANVCGECLLNPEAIQHRAVLPTECLDRIAAFCEQTAKDGIRPSLAWFGETAEALRVAAALARSAPAEKLEAEKNEKDHTRVDSQ